MDLFKRKVGAVYFTDLGVNELTLPYGTIQ